MWWGMWTEKMLISEECSCIMHTPNFWVWKFWKSNELYTKIITVFGNPVRIEITAPEFWSSRRMLYHDRLPTSPFFHSIPSISPLLFPNISLFFWGGVTLFSPLFSLSCSEYLSVCLSVCLSLSLSLSLFVLSFTSVLPWFSIWFEPISSVNVFFIIQHTENTRLSSFSKWWRNPLIFRTKLEGENCKRKKKNEHK